MLEIDILEDELFDSSTEKFIPIPACSIVLEHSLISVAKWESKWQVSYFDTLEKTMEQERDYIKCMVIGTIKNDNIFRTLSTDNILKIKSYIQNPMSATTFTVLKKKNGKKQKVTAEVIYARMFSHGIPIECQKWHLNRLLTLLRVCDLQNSSGESKMTKQKTATWNAEQNAARRAKYNNKG